MEPWRLIIDPPRPGAENMAVDEALLRGFDGGVPTLRLYGWKAPTVSIGYLQDAVPYLSSGLPVVRRITGGRAVLHDMELTYSVVASTSHPLFSGGIGPTYTAITGCIVEALRAFCIDASIARTAKGERQRIGACFSAPGRFEVVVGGRKIAGSAQRRFKGAFLQHGSILLDARRDLNEALFGPGILSRMAWVRAFSDSGLDGLRELLVKKFSACLKASFSEGGLTDTEACLRERLLSHKYSSVEWTVGAKDFLYSGA